MLLLVRSTNPCASAGKKSSFLDSAEDAYPDYSAQAKRAPSGFIGMRGKKAPSGEEGPSDEEGPLDEEGPPGEEEP